MPKQFKYEVYLKLTESGNIYVGFTKENKKIEMANEDSWTTQCHFYVGPDDKSVIVNFYSKYWNDIDLFGSDIIEFRNYIEEKVYIGALHKSYVCKVLNKKMKEKFFLAFHANSPRYENKQSLVKSLGLCTAELTEADESFKHQENTNDKIVTKSNKNLLLI